MSASRSLSADAIAAEIAETRQRLSRGLAALDREYGLRHLLLRAARAAEMSGSDRAAMEEALRRNAVPFGLIALGFGWLAFERQGDGLTGRVLARIADLEPLAEIFARPRPAKTSAKTTADDSLIT